MNKIAVIGGGAAGMTAAISAAQSGAYVTIYESGARLGRKILATGNGRCNMTNINADVSHYHGGDAEFISGAVNSFWVSETLDFFSSLGVLAKTETEGRVYPYSDQASSVLDVLRFRIEELDIAVVYNFEVKQAERTKGGFKLISYKGEVAFADKVIVATGGRAAPDFGCKGGGYDILKGLGHKIAEQRPSLVQLKTEPEIVKKLKGIKIDALISIEGHSEYGEILFTGYGLSGIAVFSLTAYLENQKTAVLDIMKDYTEEQLYEMLIARVKARPRVSLENFLVGILNKRVGQTILKQAGIAPLSRAASSLTKEELGRLAELMKNWKFKILGTKSWNNAQTTKGGALTSGFDGETMESKTVKGLYAAGEVLDIDGDCGGYNLQWAWSSGYIAGRSAAKN